MIAQDCHDGRGGQHLAGPGLTFGLGQFVEHAAGQDVDHMPPGIADEQPAGGAGRDRDLDADRKVHAAGRGDLSGLRHRGLHRERAGDGPRGGLRRKPAGDGVAAETHHAATLPVHMPNQHFVHLVDDAGDFLRAALQAELARETFG